MAFPHAPQNERNKEARQFDASKKFSTSELWLNGEVWSCSQT